ncbi:nephrocystin-3-like [Patiria miniata]|uniref:Tetratricopeptide repeat protein n=1 Tax=Patiria miniata TaxID=46514 RepID=A0A914B0C2_PATMI|nr:nephrocystin-3-like [Patiria miniata]
MCCLLVARRGLSEVEIKKILGVTDQAWSTLYFAMNEFVIERSGLYVLAYSELAEAVRQHFCTDQDQENQFRRIVADYFFEVFKSLSPRYDTQIPERVLNELPWLLCKLRAKEQLQECLLSLAMFSALFRDQHKYDLVDYWNSTGASGVQIQQMYMKALDEQVACLYTESTDETGTPPQPTAGKQQLVSVVGRISNFLEEAGHRTVLEPLLQRAIRMNPLPGDLMSADPKETLEGLYYENQLARFYADVDRFDEALAIHEKLLAIKEKPECNVSLSEKAVTVNNMGFVHLKLGSNEKALDYFEQALALHKEDLNGSDIYEVIATATNNVGSALSILGRYDEGAKVLERALEIYEELYFDSLPPDVGGTLLNLAKCHVRNPNKTPEEVQATYQRAIDIRENAYGRNHHEVAQVLMTYGAYMQRLEKTEQALDMYLEALDIFMVAYGPEGLDTAMTQENVAGSYLMMGQHEKAIPYFNAAGETLFNLGLMDQSVEYLNTSMLQYYIEQDRMEEAHHVLERVITAEFANESIFVTLDQLDERLLGDQRPNRPFKHTLDYALQKFPSSMRVLGRKLVVLAREGGADALLDLIRKNPDGKDPGLYMHAYKTFVECDHRDEGQKILLAAAELFPDDVIVLENLAKCHGFYKRYPEALAVMEQIFAVKPDDVDLMILGAKLLGMNDRLQESREKLLVAQKVATEGGDQGNVEIIASILKNIEEIMASQGNA